MSSACGDAFGEGYPDDAEGCVRTVTVEPFRISCLCHASYRDRYRVAARSRNTPDSSTGRRVRCLADR
ncbi:hypothetical protein SM007_21705 [Streptomyces avermitilis]|nr:hypothetical protein SM007_21705 [Streptomyces avermitilis]